jgi:hypothetical protein
MPKMILLSKNFPISKNLDELAIFGLKYPERENLIA